jgi:hypothetical protein
MQSFVGRDCRPLSPRGRRARNPGERTGRAARTPSPSRSGPSSDSFSSRDPPILQGSPGTASASALARLYACLARTANGCAWATASGSLPGARPRKPAERAGADFLIASLSFSIKVDRKNGTAGSATLRGQERGPRARVYPKPGLTAGPGESRFGQTGVREQPVVSSAKGPPRGVSSVVHPSRNRLVCARGQPSWGSCKVCSGDVSGRG